MKYNIFVKSPNVTKNVLFKKKNQEHLRFCNTLLQSNLMRYILQGSW